MNPRRLLACALLALASCATGPLDLGGPREDAPSVAPTRTRPAESPVAQGLPRGEPARVVRIIDGDTFEVEARAGKVTIRLIGVDTPEVSGGAECFGTEATEFLRRLIGAERVVLVYDADRTDRYGRTLAYVWRMRGKVFVNLRLVERGYATVLTVRPNVAYRERLEAAERLARLGQRGLWKDCR